jgi:DHA1 family bicyclomycin/chloramphenicol resistance-like MFS transporter
MSEGPQARLTISRAEFIAALAALMAMNAAAIDIMLPGMQQIGAALGETDENRRQLIVTAYFAGFGLFQLLFGPLSDRFGRKPPLLTGVWIYVAASVAAAFAPDFNTLLLLRFVQGAGAASTRVITTAMVRDVAGGRAMAEIMSLVMMVFMAMPVVAPMLGQAILFTGEWRLVFAFMAVAGLAIGVWTTIRIPETLAFGDRRPFTLSSIGKGLLVVVSNRTSLWYTIAISLVFAALFGFINSAQQIYVGIYGLGAWFPVAFAAVAMVMSAISFVNSQMVALIGMRRLSHWALITFVTLSATLWGLSLIGQVPFALFLGLFASIMCAFGLIGANFNAIAMEPLGALAGIASSVQGTAQTLIGAAIGAAIGQAFDGTVTPVAFGFVLVGGAALAAVLIAEKGRLFANPGERAAGVRRLD